MSACAELPVRYEPIKGVEDFTETAGLELEPFPREAPVLAGAAFSHYHRAGGTRAGALPGFFIGLHAAAGGSRLLTRDARRYRSCPPAVRPVAPS